MYVPSSARLDEMCRGVLPITDDRPGRPPDRTAREYYAGSTCHTAPSCPGLAWPPCSLQVARSPLHARLVAPRAALLLLFTTELTRLVMSVRVMLARVSARAARRRTVELRRVAGYYKLVHVATV
eukprot:COSAG03_NODE_390_length_8302_cov_70.582317_10_plen_125_part_00